jgi:uncharacterized protein (TIRG00374 family)
MVKTNRYDRFYIARYKRAVKPRKRRAILKEQTQFRYKPHMGFIDEEFFASKLEREERILHLQENKTLTQAQLTQANKTVAKQKSKKKYWSFVFLIINLIVIGIILKNQIDVQGFSSFSDLVASGANFNFIYLALLGMPLLAFIDWARFYVLLYKAIGRSRHFLSYKVAALGRYYDFVTPLGTGGQPFQVYYLSKRGVKSEIATSVPLSKYLFSQITFVTIAIIAIVTNSFAAGNNAIVVGLAWVGILLNFTLLSGVLVLSVSTRVGPKVVIGILKFLNKIKIVKNYEVAFQKVMRFVKEYQKSMRYFSSNAFVIIVSFVLSILFVFVQGTIPFLIYTAFNGFDANMWWTIISKLVILEFAVSFIPLPGGAGASELSFAAMFGSLFESIPGSFFWAILIWRFIVYYAFIIQGLFVMIYDMIIGDKKAARLKKIGFWEDFSKKNWFKRFQRRKIKTDKKHEKN